MKKIGISGRPGERRVRVVGESKLTVEAALKWILAAVVATYIIITVFVISRHSGAQAEASDVTGAGAGAGATADSAYDLEGLLLEGLPMKPRHVHTPPPLAEQKTEEEERAVREAVLLAEAERLLGREGRRPLSLRGSRGKAAV